MLVGFSRGRWRGALPATQTQPSMPAYLQGWAATNATTPQPGAVAASIYRIPLHVVKITALTTKVRPVVIATRAVFPPSHA